MNTSFFSTIETALPDPILGVTEAFRADPSPDKVNLGVGIYQDGTGAVPLLACVKEAAKRWLAQEDTKAYLPIDGVASFNTATQHNLFGSASQALVEKRVATIQSVGGSGALKLGIEFIRLAFPQTNVYVSDPSWENHRVLFEAAGAKVLTYPYYDPQTKSVALRNLTYDLDTKNLLQRAASWLLQSTLAKTMEKNISFPIGEQIDAIKQSVQGRLMNYPLAKGVTLKGKINDVRPDNVYLTPTAMVAVVYANGKVDVKVAGL